MPLNVGGKTLTCFRGTLLDFHHTSVVHAFIFSHNFALNFKEKYNSQPCLLLEQQFLL